MRQSKRNLVAVSLCIFMVFSLYACGSSGGGGGAVAPLSLSGTVTDSDREPVSGASVTLYDDTGSAVATVTADAAGRYRFRGIANGTYTVQADGGVGTFPSEMGDITLTGAVPTVDLYVPSTTLTLDGDDDGLYSQTNQADGYTVELDLSGATLVNNTLTGVYLKAIDVSRFGNGQAVSVSPLPLAADPADYITEWYAGAVVELAGDSIDDTGAPAILSLPVPTSLQAAAPAEAPLYRLDMATMTWLQVDADATDDVTVDNAVLDAGTGEFYTVDILADGLYRVGMVNSDTTAVSGVITDENSDPIHAATVYLEGVNYGYQQVVITDATGIFSGFAVAGADPIGNLEVTPCLKQAGIMLCSSTEVVVSNNPVTGAFDLGSVALPLTTGAATVTLIIPYDNEVGIVGVSGRTYSADPNDIDLTDETFLEMFADISFVASTFSGSVEAYAPGATATIDGGTAPVVVSAGGQTLTVVTDDGHTVTATVTGWVDSGSSMDVTLSISFAL